MTFCWVSGSGHMQDFQDLALPPTTTSPRSSHKRKKQSKEIQKLRARWGDCSAICLHSLVVILRVKMVKWEKVREKHVKHTAVGTDAPRVLSQYSPEPTNGDLCCFPLSLLFICLWLSSGVTCSWKWPSLFWALAPLILSAKRSEHLWSRWSDALFWLVLKQQPRLPHL